MTIYLGDFPTGKTIYVPFHTFNSSGASVTITGLAVTDIEVYRNGSVTQRASDAGYALLDTDGIDFDGLTGIHGFSIDTSDNTDAGFYAAGYDYWVVVSAITVDAQTVSFVAAIFSIDNRQLLRPTVASRTLDVSAGGEAGIDWANVGSPTTTLNLSGTSTKALEPTTAGRTLDVTATGEAGIDWANIGSPTTSVALSGTSVLLTSGTGTGQVSLTSGRVASDVTYWNGAVLTGKTGAFPEFGIVDSGTAQSATGTTLVLRSAAAFADDELIGATILIVSATAGAGQCRIITDYVSATDTATVDTWTTTPSGTIVYAIFGSPPASTGLPVPSDVTKWNGTAIATPDTAGYPKVTIKDGTGAGEIALTSGAIDTVTAVTTVNGLAANVITAASIATDAIDADAIAANAVAEIASGLPTLTQINTTRYLKNTASQKVYFTLVDSTDHVTRKTGITVTAQRSLDGAAFGSATGTVTEVGNGVYYHSTSTADINADDVVFRFTGTACDPVELHIVTAS